MNGSEYTQLENRIEWLESELLDAEREIERLQEELGAKP